MFMKFYGFRREPFNITPDPDFLYLSNSHREALAHLTYGIDTRKGFILMTGEVGVGKTTMINAMLKQLEGTRAITAMIFNTNLNLMDFFRLVSDELGLHKPYSKAEFLLTLNNFLIICHRKRQGPVVLIIDEAHNLSDELLEEIRLLMNLETYKEKLIQIVLSGQPELWERLKQPNLRQVRQRIVLRHQIEPLSAKDTEQYIRTRMRLAGGQTNIFTDRAIRKIHKYSEGVPRLINIICTYALISGYAWEKDSIRPDIIKDVVKDLELNRSGASRSGKRR